jgi:outer membrane protein assembly factor BamB
MRPPLVEKWRIQYEEPLLDLPFFFQRMIFVKEPNRYLAAYDDQKESKAWVYPYAGWLKDIDDGLLYFKGEDDTLHVVDARTGIARVVYRCRVGYRAAVFNGLLVTELEDSICAIDLTSGDLAWEFRTGDEQTLVSEICGDRDRLFLGLRDGTLRAVSVRDGTEIWRHEVSDLRWQNQGESNPPGTVVGKGSIHGSAVLVRVTHDYVIACSVDTGERVWTWRTDFAQAASGGAGCLYGDRYYLTGANGTYHIIDAASGKTELESQLYKSLPKKLHKAWGWLPLLISETHLFVGSHEGHLLSFERDSGQYAWSYYPRGGGGVIRHFVSHDRRFYYADACFRLYCLEEATS